MKSYKPEEAFNENGKLIDELAELAPRTASHGDNLMLGILLRDLKMPDLRNYAVEVPKPGVMIARATRVMGKFLRDIIKLNLEVAISGWWVRTRQLLTVWVMCLTTNRTWVGETLSMTTILLLTVG